MRNIGKNVFSVITLLLSFFLLAVFNSNNVFAVDVTREVGTKTYTYKKVDVVKFDYEYIVKFDENINDGEKSLKNAPIFAGQVIKVKFKEVGSKLFAANSDSIKIYQYDYNDHNFDNRIAGYIDQDITHTLSEDGLYKIVYSFDDSAIYTDYVYVHKDYYKAEITIENKYTLTSVYNELPIRLKVEDVSNLNHSKYYYAFGIDVNQLDFTDFTTSVVSSGETYSIDKQVNIKILDKYCSSLKQNFFVKIEKTIDGKTYTKIIKSDDLYRVTNKIEAMVYLVDDEGNALREKQYYKKNDTINIVLKFNEKVNYASLQYSLGGGGYRDLSDASSDPIDELKISYEIKADTTYVGDFDIKSKLSSIAFVTVGEDNVALNLVKDELPEFVIDCDRPSVFVQGTYDQIASKHEVNLNIEEVGSGIAKILYYADVCKIAEGDVCRDTQFSFDHALLREATYVQENSYMALIDKHFGEFDNVDLTLYVMAIDQAGNETLFVKKGFLVDNCIIASGAIDDLVLEQDIISDGEVVGKTLNFKILNTYNVEIVRYKQDEHTTNCTLRFEKEGYSYYNCISVQYDYRVRGEVVFTDKYNNTEKYDVYFAFSTLETEEKQIGNYYFDINGNRDYEIETSIYNHMNVNDDVVRLKLSSSVLNEIEKLLKLNSIPIDEDTLTKKFYMLTENELIVLQENVANEVVLPTLLELLEKVSHLEKYSSCSIKGNNCEYDLFVQYAYKVNTVSQERYIHIKILDNTLKYDILNEFNKEKEIDVNDTYANLSYNLVNSFNAQIDDTLALKNKNIIYVSVSGDAESVERVDTSKIGTYYITEQYSYNGVSSYPLVYSVRVVDREAPIIKLNDKKEIKIYVGEKFNDQGFISAADNYDTNLIVQSSWNVPLNTNEEGRYLVTYWVEDSSGNRSNEIVVTVIVERERTTVTYLILGGIVFVTLLIIVVFALIEIKTEKRKKLYIASKKQL